MPTPQHSTAEWHLDRKVPLTLIVAMLVQAVGIGIYVNDMHTRIATVEKTMTENRDMQRERDDRQDSDRRDGFALMRSQLEKINDKLDRLIETRRP